MLGVASNVKHLCCRQMMCIIFSKEAFYICCQVVAEIPCHPASHSVIYKTRIFLRAALWGPCFAVCLICTYCLWPTMRIVLQYNSKSSKVTMLKSYDSTLNTNHSLRGDWILTVLDEYFRNDQTVLIFFMSSLAWSKSSCCWCFTWLLANIQN